MWSELALPLPAPPPPSPPLPGHRPPFATAAPTPHFLQVIAELRQEQNKPVARHLGGIAVLQWFSSEQFSSVQSRLKGFPTAELIYSLCEEFRILRTILRVLCLTTYLAQRRHITFSLASYCLLRFKSERSLCQCAPCRCRSRG